MSEKKTYSIGYSVRVKDCDVVFDEEMEPGEVYVEVVEYTMTKEERNSPQFLQHIFEKSREVLDEAMHVSAVEITDD